MNTKIEALILNWKEDLAILTNDMYDLGNKPDTLRYELLATEALRLSRCISDLTETLIGQ